MADSSRLGARLGPRVARVVVDAQADHLKRTGHHRARIEAEAKHLFWRDIADERDAHLKPFMDALRGHADTPPEVEQLLGFMSTHRGELAGMLTSRAVGAGISASVASGLADWLAPINQRMMQAHPNLTIGVSDAVQSAVTGVWDFEAARAEVERQGVNAQRFDVLYQLAITYPDFATALELWRRGLADEVEVRTWLRRAGFTDAAAHTLAGLRRVILQPADLALMQLRGIINEQTGREIAAQSGVDAEDFDRLVLATGEPPGLEQLLEAFRRGFIDKDRLDRGIRQSRVRDEWTDVVEKLRFSPMQTADAVEAVVRNYITPQEGQAIAEQNGLEPSQWPTLLLAHGRPPGHDQMLQLQRRGFASQEQVDQAVRESDIKDKYVTTLRGLLHKLPAERLVVTLVKDGSLSTARAQELLQQDGFAPDVASAIVKAGSSQRTAGHKELSLSLVLELYEAHALDAAQAEAHITALGYPAADVPLLLRSAELRRELRWRDQAIATVRAGYLARHIGSQEAAAELSAIGVSSEQASYLERLWAIELKAHRRTLTEAQIVHGFRQGHLDAAETVARLEGIGYGPNDAAFLVETAGAIPRGR